jgi:hypothetical protein
VLSNFTPTPALHAEFAARKRFGKSLFVQVVLLNQFGNDFLGIVAP